HKVEYDPIYSFYSVSQFSCVRECVRKWGYKRRECDTFNTSLHRADNSFLLPTSTCLNPTPKW
ncbi:hypothetical protein PMAYCL1PPCAC_28021, partial [Pristionchus mayeri]